MDTGNPPCAVPPPWPSSSDPRPEQHGQLYHEQHAQQLQCFQLNGSAVAQAQGPGHAAPSSASFRPDVQHAQYADLQHAAHTPAFHGFVALHSSGANNHDLGRGSPSTGPAAPLSASSFQWPSFEAQVLPRLEPWIRANPLSVIDDNPHVPGDLPSSSQRLINLQPEDVQKPLALAYQLCKTLTLPSRRPDWAKVWEEVQDRLKGLMGPGVLLIQQKAARDLLTRFIEHTLSEFKVSAERVDFMLTGDTGGPASESPQTAVTMSGTVAAPEAAVTSSSTAAGGSVVGPDHTRSRARITDLSVRASDERSSLASAKPAATLSRAARNSVHNLPSESISNWTYQGVVRWKKGGAMEVPLTADELAAEMEAQADKDSAASTARTARVADGDQTRRSARSPSPSKGAKGAQWSRTGRFEGLRERWSCGVCKTLRHELVGSTSNLAKHSKTCRAPQQNRP